MLVCSHVVFSVIHSFIVALSTALSTDLINLQNRREHILLYRHTHSKSKIRATFPAHGKPATSNKSVVGRNLSKTRSRTPVTHTGVRREQWDRRGVVRKA